MPKFYRSVALIPNSAETNAKWLCRLNHDEHWFDVIAAEPKANESFRDCLHRKVLVSLNLTNRDILTASAAQLNLDFVGTLPDTSSDAHIVVSFYIVHLYNRTARAAVDTAECRWLTGKELLNGQTLDGWRVNPKTTYLLARADIIPTW